jgi:hypothetical protein
MSMLCMLLGRYRNYDRPTIEVASSVQLPESLLLLKTGTNEYCVGDLDDVYCIMALVF